MKQGRSNHHKHSSHKKKQSFSTPSEMQYISLIIQNVSNIEINQNTLYIFPNNISISLIDEETAVYLNNIKFISKHINMKYNLHKLSLSNSLSLVTVLLQCILFDIEHNPSETSFFLLQHLLLKLYNESLLTIDNLITIVRFSIITSMLPRTNEQILNDMFKVNFKNKRILNLNTIHKTINLVMALNIPRVTYNFCIFYKEYILKNKTNFYL